jgi:hypothetical protein
LLLLLLLLERSRNRGRQGRRCWVLLLLRLLLVPVDRTSLLPPLPAGLSQQHTTGASCCCWFLLDGCVWVCQQAA